MSEGLCVYVCLCSLGFFWVVLSLVCRYNLCIATIHQVMLRDVQEYKTRRYRLVYVFSRSQSNL